MRSPAGTGAPDGAVDALQGALAAEHAALWCYALAIAFLAPGQLEQARADAAVHREQRGEVEEALTGLGARPGPAQPAYATPRPVVDGASAAALLVVAETDGLAAWRSVLERTTDGDLRLVAMDALSAATLRCARWRTVVGASPAIPTFPGLPAP